MEKQKPSQLDKLIAQDLEIEPEQVTPMFIHEFRKRMYADPQFRACEPGQSFLQTSTDREIWHNKCKAWAKQIITEGPTPCT